MADGTKIEWADASINPVRARSRATGRPGWFCVHVSDGCTNCYSETLNRRLGTGVDYKAQNRSEVEVYLDEKILAQPLRWKRGRRIFWNSMNDTFGDFVPDDWIDRIMAVCALTPQHQHLFLTKRAERMRNYFAADRMGYIEGRAKRILRERSRNPDEPVMVGKTLAGTWPWPHVWLGVSVEDQRRADERVPLLLDTTAAVRWISAEPLLGPIDLTFLLFGRSNLAGGEGLRRIRWAVVGGESGSDARPMLASWARSIRDQSQIAGISFFFKQWGEWIDADQLAGTFPELVPLNFQEAERFAFACGRPFEHHSDGSTMIRVGKKAAGRLLDGQEWSEYPI
jgi:protein gp37